MTRTPRRPALQWGIAFIVGAFALDQATKAMALASREAIGVGLEVFPFFNFVLLRNTGVSFGMFAGHTLGQWPVILLTVAIVTALVAWLTRVTGSRQAGALGAMIGGALGNVIDRFRHGGVTDFLDSHIAGYHWPAFNLADAAIFLGVVTLVLARDEQPQSDRALRDSN